MGQLIREAREEMAMTQAQLAQGIYTRQASVSDMENGKMEPSASMLLYLAGVLEKPVIYFFPEPWRRKLEVSPNSLHPNEQELIIQFRRIYGDEHRRIAVNQVRALAELEIREDIQEQREEIEELLSNQDDAS
jgi:transcriptional regulator with XRE-family HTH domain